MRIFRSLDASLFDGIDGEVAQVSGDGAYDTFDRHNAIAQRAAVAIIFKATAEQFGTRSPSKDMTVASNGLQQVIGLAGAAPAILNF